MHSIDDFVFGRDLEKNRSAKEQAKNGLRLGLSSGVFLIALMFLGNGLRQVAWPVASAQEPFGSNWVGWVEIVISGVLLWFTAQVWLLLLGGFALFGFIKGVLVLITGQELYPPHRPFPRTESAEIAVFALTTLLLLFRFVNAAPTTLDRCALTLYVFALGWHGDLARFSLADPWQMAGLVGLAISWSIYRWKRLRRQSNGSDT